MARTVVAVLFGGISEEHPVSLKSATEVGAALDPTRYDPVWVGISQQGTWHLCAGPGEVDTGNPEVIVPQDREGGALLVRGGDRVDRIPVDVVLPVLHGRLGEDGAIQGVLEVAGLPYGGCGIAASALCMDKALTYLVARAAGVRTPEVRTVLTGESPDADRIAFPVFVKPARSGSSFGVSRVDRSEDLAEAIELARGFDSRVLVEGAVIGAEVGCAVLGSGWDLTVGEVDRVALSHGFFRIHQEDRPEDGSENASFVVPADIPDVDRDRVRETARTVYRALGCTGLARVDLFLTADGTVVLNEVNTLPGLTSYSRYPRMMAAAGMPLSAVLDRVIADALGGRGDG